VRSSAGLDTTAYADLARQVLAGNVALGPGLYFVSPFYIYFLAAALAIFRSVTAVRVLQVGMGTLAVACTFFTAREWFGARAGWYAAGLAALTGLFTFYEAILLQAAVDPFLTAAALLALTLGLKQEDRRWLRLSGAVFGLAALNRPNIPLAVAGIAATLAATRRVAPAAVLAAGLLAGLAPVAIRNIVVSGQWSLVSSHGGLNFYIGNSEAATGFFHPIPGITPSIAGQAEDARRVAERAAGHPLTDAGTSSYFFGLAWQWITAHPGAALSLFARKLAYVFSAQHVTLPHSYPFYAYDAGTALRVLFVGPWLLLPLGLTGLIAAAPAGRRTAYLAWAAFVPGYAAGVAAFFVAERYRLPLLVPLCAGAGAAVDLAARAVVERRRAALVVPAAVFVALFAFANWPRGLHDGRWEEELRMAQRLIVEGRYDEAERWAQRS
jgi:4-amino-4-deoxy-L-arabinose transferase-like glycosyltransferase